MELKLVALVALSSANMVAAGATVAFSREIAPVIVAKCATCHSAEKAKGGFRVHTFEALNHSGKSKAAPIVPGKPEQSELFKRLVSSDPDERMPQKDDPLSAEQIDLFRRWIAEGGSLDSGDPKLPLTAVIPRLPSPAPPEQYSRALPILALAFSADGSTIAASGHYEVTLWNTSGELQKRITNVAQRVHGIVFHPGESRIAVAGGLPGRSGELCIYNTATGTLETNLVRASDELIAVALSIDGKRLAAGGADNTIHLFNWETRAKLLTIQQHADWVTSLSFNEDGTRIASASRDRTARIYNTASGDLETTFAGHSAFVYSVAFLKSGQIASAGREKAIQIWSAADGKKKREIGGFDGEIYQLIAAEDFLFSASADKQVRQYALSDFHLVRKFEGHSDAVYALAFCPATDTLASGSYDGSVRLWNGKTGELLRTFIAAPGFQTTR